MSVAVKKNQLELPIPDRRKFQPQNFVHTSLFSEVYVFNDIPIQFKALWERIEDHGRFDQFFNGLVTLMESFSLEDAHKWNHTETLNNLIFPMLEILGYGDAKSKNNAILENCGLSIPNEDGTQIDLKPSLLFCEDEAGKNYIKNSAKTNSKAELKKYLKLPIQTSYYGSTFDRKSNKYEFKKDEIGKRGDVLTNLGPNDQMAEYLKIFNVDWGIFTDGAVWRLYRKEMSATYSEKYYEFDLNDLYNLYRTSGEDQHDEHSEFFEIAKYMFWFFSYDGLIKGPSVVPFTEKVYQESQKYVANIEENLKERFVHAMTICCNGYLQNFKGDKNAENLRLIAKTSESLIFNLIFIRSCETRRILPVHQDYIHVSLKALIEKARHFSFQGEPVVSSKIVWASMKDIFNKLINNEGYEVYEYIKHLHNVVENGDNGFGISGFVESVFYPEERNFYKKNKINNMEMVKLLFQLFYDFNDGKNVQIPYNLITPGQLGSVYESFLEFQPEISSCSMYYVKKIIKKKSYWQWVQENGVPADKKAQIPCVKKGEIIFAPNNKERKTTGSYYTPDYIVNFIVRDILGGLCQGKDEDEILKLKVLDPAMGSGHFLIGSLEFLSKKIAEKTTNKSLTEIKRSVLDSCIYGVDLNPSAVKLGKMSLWLATALPGLKLERLTDQLLVGNSLVNDEVWEPKFNRRSKMFDAIVGNPPYMICELIDRKELEILKDRFSNVYSGKLDYSSYFYPLYHKLLKSNGKVGIIAPRYFLDGVHSKKLREFISGNLSYDKIVNFGNNQVFDVNSLTIIIEMTSKSPVGDCEVYDLSSDLSKEEIKCSLSSGVGFEVFKVEQVSLKEKGSSRLSSNSSSIENLFASTDDFVKLGEKFFVGAGIQSGCVEAFVKKKADVRELKLPSADLKLTIKNGDIRAYHAYNLRENYIIYPHSKMSAATKKHLEGYKSKLAGRYEYKKGKCDLLEYSVPRNLDRVLAMKKKIIVPYMAPDNRYCVDSNGIVASVDVYFIEPNNDFCSAEALVCILNSAICNIQHKSVAKLKRDGYYEYFSNSIEKYLLPKYIPLKTDEKLRDLYSKIIKSFEELSQQYKSKADLDKLEQSILKFPNYLSSRSTDPRLQSIIDLKFAIDQIVSDLYKVKHNSVLKLCA